MGKAMTDIEWTRAEGDGLAAALVHRSGYSIELSTIQSFADVVRWSEHLSPKNWVTGQTLFTFQTLAMRHLPPERRPGGWDAKPL